MGEHGGQVHQPGRLVDGGRLHGSDLMLPQSLDIASAGERRISETALGFSRPCTHLRTSVLSIITGGGKWVEIAIPMDPQSVTLANGRAPGDGARVKNAEFSRAKSGTFDRKGLIEFHGCGAGILLIKRACIDEMLKKFQSFQTLNSIRFVVDGARLSEWLPTVSFSNHRCSGIYDAPVI